MRMIDELALNDRMTAIIVVVMLFWGCAHTPPSTPSDAAVQKRAKAVSVKRMEAIPTQSNATVVMDEGSAYEMVKTPFGVVKRKLAATLPPTTPTPSAADQTPQVENSHLGMSGKPAPAQKQPKQAAAIQYPPAENTRKPASAGGESAVTLNFDDADLYEVIRTMAEILRINYIVDPNIRGKVTIHTAGQIERDDLFPIFFQILEANGLTAVREGAIYKISSLKDSARLPIYYRQGETPQMLPPGERIVMQLIPLKNIEVAEMTKLLTPFISADGTIISHSKTNTLLIVDKGINILKALKLIEGFDVDLFSTVKHQFYTIENFEVSEFANLLREVLNVYLGSQDSDVKTIPIKPLNMLLVMSQRQQVFDTVAELMTKLDVPNETVQPRLYVYPVKNGEAEELSMLLGDIFRQTTSPVKTEQKTETTEKVNAPANKTSSNPFAKPEPKKDASQREAYRPSGSEAASETLRGDVRITADKIRNTLIIEASPSDYKIVSNILQRLDVLPRQVLIEAMLAEVTLDDSTKLGVEWSYLKGNGGTLSTSLLSATMGSGGMQYVIGQTDRWTTTLEALASESKVNILSAPTVLASNDNEASINISTEVPVASAQYQYNDASSAPVVTTNIEYRNTGIILTVTPHINENGLVSMDISQEVSEQAGDVVVGDQSYPSFFQRTVKTTLTVGHNQTIVIGGLIRENKSKGKSGVPGIYNIPIIGSLFGTRSNSSSKTELIVLITPRVIVNLSDVDAVTEAFRSKVPSTL